MLENPTGDIEQLTYHPTGHTVWDDRYKQAELAYGAEPNDFLRAHAAEIPSSPVLEIGAGQGRNAIYLASLGLEVEALDQSPVGLARANEAAAEAGLELRTIVADLAEWRFPTAAYGAIVSIWCHLPPDLRVEVHAGIQRALVPGGLLILEAYTPAQVELGTGGPPVRDLMMTAKSLREELPDLEFLSVEERQREVHEGRYHDGLSAVVQLVARRPLS